MPQCWAGLPVKPSRRLWVAFEPVGVMLECFVASSGGRKVALNLCGHTGVAWAFTLLHAQERKHLRSD